MYTYRFLTSIAAILLGRTPAMAQGRTLTVDLGATISFPELVGNAVEAFALISILFTTVLFLVGAFMMVMSRGKEDQVSKGKDLMIQSLIGMAVVGGAYALIRTIFWLIYVA
ncbi:hypothetical protein A3D88_04090 [Candidatus Peribacteria bacterium RIFCSPHIGHO2_02_FULL_52_16]|nr:MAG: hypothetical protein A2706_03445 [Candidatus Peribacteria bacterium RIFCSPHIGHO2_01_FULL_51_35]OGJ60752.1 MAG: hypothetical protein A3D88_04090 [Candidatus Peribacteria bacterium RIFCSPHIGHO2_02_FULL_52_16]